MTRGWEATPAHAVRTLQEVKPMPAVAPARVLVATDLSDQAALAVRRAAQLARQHHATLRALYVVPTGLDPHLAAFALVLLRAHLDRHAAVMAGGQAIVRHGSVAHQISAETAETIPTCSSLARTAATG